MRIAPLGISRMVNLALTFGVCRPPLPETLSVFVGMRGGVRTTRLPIALKVALVAGFAEGCLTSFAACIESPCRLVLHIVVINGLDDAAYAAPFG